MKALDDHVLVALNEALTDEEQVWDLITERANRWKREHERPKKERENIERQVKRIEAEIANLTRQAARGLDIDVQEFNSRRAQVEELRRKLEAPAEIDLDRDALRAGLTMVKHFKGGLTLIDDPSKDYIGAKPALEAASHLGPFSPSCVLLRRSGFRGRAGRDVTAAATRPIGFRAVELLVGARHRILAIVGDLLDALVELSAALVAVPREAIALVGSPLALEDQHERVG